MEEELGDESSPWLELAREDFLSKQELEDYSPWLELAKELFLEKEKLGDDSPCLELRELFLSKEGLGYPMSPRFCFGQTIESLLATLGRPLAESQLADSSL